ncbi:MAG: nucleotidyltransferase domain-containing protein [Acidobacteria bacterium]|nr:nucleotidyltransferase domain-containing protein [Planctomycetota bacterium]MBE3135060.1 nucleotidyltransferase domain-containing protein [Acidobacteriota bacterium]
MLLVSALDVLAAALAQEPVVRLAVLFGSAATRSDGPPSDLDVGVLLSTESIDLSALGVRLERATGRPVDLVDLAAAPPLLRLEIARHGEVLLEREPHTWAECRAHAMIDWWDWAPTARMAHRALMGRLREEAARGRS